MIEAKKLRKGNYIIYKEKPYRIRRVESKVIGTHSHSVIKVELESILERTHETFSAAPTERFEEIEIIRKLGQFICRTPSTIQIMSMDNYEVFDAEILPEIISELKDGCNVTYIEFKGKKFVIEVRK